MAKTYYKTTEEFTGEGTELRQPVAELAIINSVSELVIYQDTEHRILWANKASAESVGLAPPQLVGRHCYEILHQRSQPCINCPVAKARQTGKGHKVEKTAPDGRIWSIRGYPILDEFDHVTGMIGLALNITERKQMEQALQAEKNKLSSIIDAMEDGLTIRDRDYNLTYQSKTSIETSGEHLGEKCYRALEGQERVCDDCPVEKAFQDGRSHTAVRRLVTPTGEVTFWENTASPIRDTQGNIVACLEIGKSITERKQAEEREKELQKELHLSSRLASIGELAAGVAHQLNNPLTGVLGFSQRLLRKSTDQETNQDLKMIYTEAERAAKVVQNLLTFARRRQPHKQYSDINEIIESALELRAYEMKTSNIEVVTNLAPNLPQTMLDFYQIQEVFLNVILNAEQALNEANGDGKLIIKTEKNKGYIRVSFADNGPGIPAEKLYKIFDPFYTTKKEGGTGLGLSVCHGIITEHGGRIYAKSKVGKGTTFFVELPLGDN
jgi:PAS domain S-box-containing protein